MRYDEVTGLAICYTVTKKYRVLNILLNINLKITKVKNIIEHCKKSVQVELLQKNVGSA